MTNVSKWDIADGGNNNPSPAGAPENMAASGLNDTIRAVQGAVARLVADIEGTLVSTGSANAYEVATNSVHVLMADITPIVFLAHAANTGGACTIDVDGLGVTSIKRPDGTNPIANDIPTTGLSFVAYDTTNARFTLLTAQPTLPIQFGVWTDLASAATVDLGAESSSNIQITGTTSITSFGSTSDDGEVFNIRFAAALTLTHNATNLILPGGANITTAANDTCKAVALGSGNFIVFGYKKQSGEALAFNVSGLTALTELDNDVDYLPIYDDSGAANKKVSPANLRSGALGYGSYRMSSDTTLAFLSYATLVWDTLRSSELGMSMNTGTGVLTLSKQGVYFISLDLWTEYTKDNTWISGVCRAGLVLAEIDDGGFSFGQGNHGSGDAGGSGQIHKSFLLTTTADDWTFDVQAQMWTGTGGSNAYVGDQSESEGQSNLTVLRVA